MSKNTISSSISACIWTEKNINKKQSYGFDTECSNNRFISIVT